MAVKKDAPRVVFMGSDPIGLPLLDYLYAQDQEQRIDLYAVFTQPDRPQGRGKIVLPNAIKIWAQERKLAVYQAERLEAAHSQWLKDHAISLACVMAYGQILKKDFLDALPLGAINWHGSILPKYRGASPVETAILEGENESGLSLIYMTPKMDAGPIIGTASLAIELTDTASSLREKIGKLAPQLTALHWENILNARAPTRLQDEATISYTRKLHKADAWLDFNQSASRLEQKIRALNPWPGTQCEHRGTLLKIHRARAVCEETMISEPPGTVLALTAATLDLATAKGLLAISHLQRPGGKVLDIKAFLNAYPIAVGDLLKGQPKQPFVSPKPFRLGPK